MNSKNNFLQYFSALVAVLVLGFFGYLLFQKFSVKTVSYSGFSDSEIAVAETKKDVVIKSDKNDSDTIDFSQRKLNGGGNNPGWTMSTVETQPNIFTGRIIVDDGVYQYPALLKEEATNIFVGEMKNKDGKKLVLSLRKTETKCKDEEGNVFEYTLSGTYGATNISGCGGTLLSAAE